MCQWIDRSILSTNLVKVRLLAHFREFLPVPWFVFDASLPILDAGFIFSLPDPTEKLDPPPVKFEPRPAFFSSRDRTFPCPLLTKKQNRASSERCARRASTRDQLKRGFCSRALSLPLVPFLRAHVWLTPLLYYCRRTLTNRTFLLHQRLARIS